MNKVLISVLGSDQPGIMANIAKVIQDNHGNIENINQTLLKNVFGALLVVEMDTPIEPKRLQQKLAESCQNMALYIQVHSWDEAISDWYQQPQPTQPYIITVIGPDKKGIVAEVSQQLFKHGINITNMTAMFNGGENPLDNLMIFEIDIPKATVMDTLRHDLNEVASKLYLDISLQHRKIFDSVSQILN